MAELHPKASRKGLAILLIPAGILAAAAIAAFALLGGDGTPSLRLTDPLTRARRLLDEGRIAEAKAIYLEELKKDPKRLEAVKGMALAARDEGSDEEAVTYLYKWTELEPKNPIPWRHLARALHRLGRDMEALSAAQTAMALTPGGDPAMSELVTKLLASPASPWDPLSDPLLGGQRRRSPGGPPLPEPPDPTKDLPAPGRPR